MLEQVSTSTSSKRILRNFSVKNNRGDSLFGKFYLEKYCLWISIGHFISYSSSTSTATSIMRLLEIKSVGTAHVTLTGQPLKKVSDDTVFGAWTDVYQACDCDNTMIDTSTQEFDISIFPIQPDFTREGYYFACFSIKIM